MGDTFTTLIHTAELHGKNLFDYLPALPCLRCRGATRRLDAPDVRGHTDRPRRTRLTTGAAGDGCTGCAFGSVLAHADHALHVKRLREAPYVGTLHVKRLL